VFLLKNNFGRGTLTINGRIQFNYPSAHRFFIFFFVPYANNIGIHFRKGAWTQTSCRASPGPRDDVHPQGHVRGAGQLRPGSAGLRLSLPGLGCRQEAST
jgi:hypothetical protein